MLKCLREEITSGGCLSKQVPNAKLMAFIFLKKGFYPRGNRTSKEESMSCISDASLYT